jgi:hypothetical protein
MSKTFIQEWEEEELKRLYAESMNKQAFAKRVNLAQNMLTGSGGSGGSGMLSSAGTQNIASAQSSLNTIYREEAIKNRGVVGEFRIEQVSGGFIVCSSREPYGPADRHIAITLEDVSRIMMAQMASNMLDKS